MKQLKDNKLVQHKAYQDNKERMRLTHDWVPVTHQLNPVHEGHLGVTHPPYP